MKIVAYPTHGFVPDAVHEIGVLSVAHAVVAPDEGGPAEWAVKPDSELDAAMHGLLQMMLERGGRHRLREALGQGAVPALALRALAAH